MTTTPTTIALVDKNSSTSGGLDFVQLYQDLLSNIFDTASTVLLKAIYASVILIVGLIALAILKKVLLKVLKRWIFVV